MPIPQPVLDLVNSLQLSVGDPTFRNPGDLLHLSISPDPIDALNGLLNPQVLGTLNLSVLLEGILSPVLIAATSTDQVGPSPVPVSITLNNAAGFSIGGLTVIEMGTVKYELQPIVDIPQNNVIKVAALNLAHDGSAQPFSVQTFAPDTTTLAAAINAAAQALLATTSQVDVIGVSKAVEFDPLTAAQPVETKAIQINTGQSARDALPYLIPGTVNLSPEIEGLLSHLTGNLAGTQQNPLAGGLTGALTSKMGGVITGSIVGNITNSVLNAQPVINITWHVRDSSGADLRPNLDFVQLGTSAAPVFVFLPAYAELTSGGLPNVERDISCDIDITCANPAFHVTKTLGPIAIQVPEVQIPTLVVFTFSTTVVFGGPPFPGVLLGVPANSVVTDPSQVAGALGTIAGFLGAIGAAPVPAGVPAPLVLGNCAAAAGVIAMILPFLAAGVANFRKQNGVRNLWWIWPWGDYSDTIGGALMIGPPGRGVRCYKASADIWGNYVARKGAIDITVGATGAVSVPSFASGMPPAAAPAVGDPSDSSCSIVVAAGLMNFDALMNAYQFL